MRHSHFREGLKLTLSILDVQVIFQRMKYGTYNFCIRECNDDLSVIMPEDWVTWVVRISYFEYMATITNVHF